MSLTNNMGRDESGSFRTQQSPSDRIWTKVRDMTKSLPVLFACYVPSEILSWFLWKSWSVIFLKQFKHNIWRLWCKHVGPNHIRVENILKQIKVSEAKCLNSDATQFSDIQLKFETPFFSCTIARLNVILDITSQRDLAFVKISVWHPLIGQNNHKGGSNIFYWLHFI